MKRLVLVITTVLVFQACTKSRFGELTGVKSKNYHEPTPHGMSFVSRGTFTLGPNNQEVVFSQELTKTVSLDAFWIDDTEISNSEYRQFVYWVRDSIARQLLGAQFPEFLVTEDKEGNPIEHTRINWKTKINWDDPAHADALKDLFISEEERFFEKREIDSRKLFYNYEWIDLRQAAKKSNRYDYQTARHTGYVFDEKGKLNPVVNRASFVMHEMTHVYPDTLCWIRDFTYSYNDPRTIQYFYHPGFEDYPVVGVSWKQAKAFCAWRTQLKNSYLRNIGEPDILEFRLPTEAEWEYAAKGNRTASIYPWGGYYTRGSNGRFLGNFKPLRGDYVADGGMATVEIGSYDPNDFGLYDMSGNVAEWTSNAFDESAYAFVHDFNPNYEYNAKIDDPATMKRKVIRGGSWKDIAAYQQVGTRSYEYQDSANSYIGFRCVRSTFRGDF